MKVGSKIRTLVALPVFVKASEAVCVLGGTFGEVVEIYLGDDDTYVVMLDLPKRRVRTTFASNEIGLLIEEVPQ